MRKAFLASCAALAIGLVVSGTSWAQEAVRLEYKLKPGMALLYKSVGTFTMKSANGKTDSTTEGRTSATLRTVVIETDAKTGDILAGELVSQTDEERTVSTSEGEIATTQKQVLAQVCHVDRTGKGIATKPIEAGKRSSSTALAEMELSVMERKNLDILPLPAAAVAVGATWPDVWPELQIERSRFSVYSYPELCKVSSTLAEVKEVQGKKFALIKSKLSPAMFSHVTGEADTLFDMERGVVQERTITMRVSSVGEEGTILEIATTEKLDSIVTVPADELARIAIAVHALDSAVAQMRADDADKAVEVLRKAAAQDLPDAWKKGLARAIVTAQDKTPSVSHFAQPLPFLSFVQFLHGAPTREAGSWTQQLPEGKETDWLVKALSSLAHVEGTPLVPPSAAEYEKALAALRAIEAEQDTEYRSLAARCAASVLEKYVGALSEREGALQTKVKDAMALSAKYEKDAKYGAAMLCLVKALRCRRTVESLEDRMSQLIKRYGEAGQPKENIEIENGAGASGAKDPLSPALRDLGLRLLHEGLKKELTQAVDKETDEYWRTKFGISDKMTDQFFDLSKPNNGLEYLSVCTADKLSEKINGVMFAGINMEITFGQLRALEHLTEVYQVAQEKARSMIGNARKVGKETSWHEARESVMEYERSLRDYRSRLSPTELRAAEDEIRHAKDEIGKQLPVK